MPTTRKLKVCPAPRSTDHERIPAIHLKGQWLKEYGFTENTPIQVLCEHGKLTITLREPDPEPVPDYVSDIWNNISSLTKKQRKTLDKYLPNLPDQL